MQRLRSVGVAVTATLAVGALVVVGITTTRSTTRSTSSRTNTGVGHRWREEAKSGSVRFKGAVPLAVSHGTATYVRPHPAGADVGLNFAFPIRDKNALDKLILQESRTHRYISRAELYSRFAPPQAQVDALSSWLKSNGFRITHVGLDRLSISAHAPTSTVQKVLHVKLNDYIRPGYRFRNIKVSPYRFYSNATPPVMPARFGVRIISGLSDVDRFFTAYQLAPRAQRSLQGSGNPNATDVRSGGYFPTDLRTMYDVAGHGFDGTGQTLGFTLWGAAERQAAMTAFATTTGDQLITVDPNCVPTGNSPTVPSSCVNTHVAGDHLMTILENGNLNNQFGANVETALDIEQAHGIATHAGMKYYIADCTNTPPVGSGLTNGSNCNGSDVGIEEAIEDAANDPTLHTVSNSWGFGGEAQWGAVDPFMIASENSFAIAAAAGTTFYFSTGDSGTYFSGYPADSQYVVGVGGTTLFSTGTTAPFSLSTETTWAAAGSWCSNIIARPAWQNGPGVAANASCAGRAVPDISAIADTNSSVRFTSSTNTTGGTQSGGVGGTSVAAPELNGLAAVTENFIAAQTYAGPTPAMGFAAPVMYQMGNSPNYDNYFRDVYCGNTANPSGGPEGDAALPGWDAATGWGAPDWYNYSIGYARTLGATNLAVPPSLSKHYKWKCAKTPGNSSERGISCPTSSTCYSVGTASGATPWYAKFLAGGSWGAVNTFYKSTNGGQSWFPSNGDMMSIACTSSSTCVEVGDGGRIKRTTDSGATWPDVTSPTNKSLTQVRCPSSSVCYAAGDRGAVLKSSDGGVSWSFLPVVDGNPIYGLACPTTSVCYATDIYAHVTKTSDGGASWTWQSTPVTTPGLSVPGSGGPNPFAGLFGITCVDASTCVAVGGFPPTGTDPPIVTTTDGGATWTKRTSNSGTNNYLHAVSCAPGTTTCWAVGRGGSIVTSSDLVTWTKVTSGTTNALNTITCLSASFCVASGQNGTVDIWSGTAWAVTTGLGGNVFLSGVACPAAGTCFIVGKQGVTLATTNNGGAWAQQAGGGTTSQMNSVSCTSADACVAAGAGGTVLQTTNGGQTWLARTSGTTNALNGVSCATTACVAVGAAGTARVSTDGGGTWAAGTSGTTQALNGVSCSSSTACIAVGAAGTIIGSATGGTTWSPQTSGTTTALNAVACPSATTCYAAGAVTAGSAVLVKTANGGTNWATQPSSSAQALTGVACLTSSYCFAGGAIGTVVGTSDGTTWTQQGNPLSGPTTALNTAATTLTAINAAACNATRCIMGAASSGNILTTPLLTVTAHTVSEFGTVPDLTGLTPNDPEISYSPAGEAANVTGTLSCSSTATSSSAVGTYPVSSCSGLDDDGFNIVYDYDNSSHTVVKAHQAITFAAIGDKTYGDADFDAVAIASSGLAVSFTATGNCTISGATVHITAAGSCTVTASQPGNGSYEPAVNVARTFSIARASQTIDFGALDDQTFGNADFVIDATATSGLPVHVAVTSGPCTLSGDTAPANAHISGAGTCVVTASQGGDSNYEPAPDVERSFAIAKAGQTITFGPLAGKTYGDADFAVSATASSGLAVAFSAAGACTVASGTVHIVATGSCTITASQAGDDNWNPAPDVSQSFAIAKERTVTAYTGFIGDVLNGTTVVLSGTLRADGGPVIVGRTLTLTLGSGATAQRCLATTGATGAASCSVTVNQTPGAKPVSASFAGDSLYLPSASAEGTASVFTANSLMQDVLAQLQALGAGASKQDGDKLDDAVKKLTDALDPSLWVDGNRVDGQHGDRVFDRSRDAVGKLMDLLKKGSIPAATIQSLIDELVHADRILAEGAVADAIAAPVALHRVGGTGKGPKKHDLDKIAQAQQELANAADEVAAGNFDNAIEHYRNAWKKAEDALR